MTPLSTDNLASMSRTEPVRRVAPADAVRPAAAGSDAAGTTGAVPGGSGARPGVVVNLESSANRAALSGLTYGNPRNSAAMRAADANSPATPRQFAAPRDTAPGEMRNSADTLVATRSDARATSQAQGIDRQAQQAAAASGMLRQAMAPTPA